MNTSEQSDIATITGTYTFNSTYNGASSSLDGLEVELKFEILRNNHWGNLTVSFYNPTGSAIDIDGTDTGNRMGYTLGFGSVINGDHSNDYQAWSINGQVTIGQTMSWNFVESTDLEWSGIYDLQSRAFAGIVTLKL